ncbi:MAG TPA: hypothetical protein VNV66_12570 [Pilimelia sp.]|nr:hypothetical protein [Pilimelia sp.]
MAEPERRRRRRLTPPAAGDRARPTPDPGPVGAARHRVPGAPAPGGDLDDQAGPRAGPDPAPSGPRGRGPADPRTADGPADPRTGSGPAGPGRPDPGLRGLATSAASQVSLDAALRARDAARPRPADLAAAEAELRLVRRNWLPPGQAPPPGQRPRQAGDDARPGDGGQVGPPPAR